MLQRDLLSFRSTEIIVTHERKVKKYKAKMVIVFKTYHKTICRLKCWSGPISECVFRTWLTEIQQSDWIVTVIWNSVCNLPA